MALDKRRDLAVITAEDQITFPVTGHGAIF
jgi:hypothetical protein